jgi:heme-degrading monooxygenase HmoA
MIAREWRCLCPSETAAGFLQHLGATGVAEARALPGCLGHLILRREAPRRGDGGEMVEFTLLTFWRDEDSLRAFAGDDASRAVLYPGDEAFRIVSETTVRHYEVPGAELAQS